LEIVQKISSLLTPNNPGIGNWKNLGNEYKMPSHTLNALGPDQAAEAVLEYIKAANPDLTVYDFCEVMKKLTQNKVVKLLKNNLTTETGKCICHCCCFEVWTLNIYVLFLFIT
jgi:hypothetical protein